HVLGQVQVGQHCLVMEVGVVVLAPGRLVPLPSGRLVTAPLPQPTSVNQSDPGVEGILADGFLRGGFGGDGARSPSTSRSKALQASQPPRRSYPSRALWTAV